MAGSYGASRAAKLIDEGDYEAAVVAAGAEAARDPDDPEPLVLRATALGYLERHGEALADYGRALELDRAAQLLDEPLVDDACFSTILALARAEAQGSVDAGLRRLEEYRRLFPGGSHLGELPSWARVLRGDLPRELTKERSV